MLYCCPFVSVPVQGAAMKVTMMAFVLIASMASADASRADEAPVPTAAASATPVGVAALAGRWVVDLRAAPDQPRYEKPMVLSVAPDKSVAGSFYDSEIEAGRASASNDRLCFAFRTTDGVGPYHTSGCLVGDRILGQTWSEHRQFVLNWTAVRE
jgi:hypothetical protein